MRIIVKIGIYIGIPLFWEIAVSMKKPSLTQATLPPQQYCLECTAVMCAGSRNILDLSCRFMLHIVAGSSRKCRRNREKVRARMFEVDNWFWHPSCLVSTQLLVYMKNIG